MSRNYELLTSVGETTLLSPRRPEPAIPPAPLSSIPRVSASNQEIQLVQRLFLIPGSEAPRSVVFCGLTEEKESALLSARVSEILAADPSRRICLVDANVYAPSLHERYGVPTGLGVADAVFEAGPIRDFAQRVGESGLWLIPACHRIAEQPVVWPSERLSVRWSELREEFDCVVICAPAIHLHPDAISLGRVSDGVVLVLKENFTRREVVRKAKENLEASNVRVLGAVVTQHTPPATGAFNGIS